MVYICMRYAVADYAAWRGVFDANVSTRLAAGCTGTTNVYRDVDEPNTVTLVMEWDSAENARKFMDDPALRERMKAAGAVGAPLVRTIVTMA